MYKIGDFSKKVNISIKTLRYYDDIDLFKPSYQDYYTGYRYYQENQVDELKKIINLKEINLSLEEIKRYIETKDINIIINKEREFEMKMKKIKEYINTAVFTVKEGNYDDYIKYNGLKMQNKPIALELRDKNCKYYIIYNNDEYYSDIVVFHQKDNLINLNITYGIKNYLETLIEYLKKDFDFLTFKSDENKDNKLEIIREKCKCVSESKEKIETKNNEFYELTSIRVDLTKNNIV